MVTIKLDADDVFRVISALEERADYCRDMAEDEGDPETFEQWKASERIDRDLAEKVRKQAEGKS